MVLARPLALGALCLLFGLAQFLLVAGRLAVAALASLVMGVMALVILAFMAAESRCGRSVRPHSWLPHAASSPTVRAQPEVSG